MTTVKFGVVWDKATPRVLAAILRDVMAYSRLLPPGVNLTLVTDNPMMFVGSNRVPRTEDGLYDLGGILVGIERRTDGIECAAWKLYYEVKRPPIPSGAKQVYYSRVGDNGTKRIELSKDDPRYPSLHNPQDERIVPPGKSPNINKIPPRYYSNFPNTPYRLM
jgi:hypothetical protein